MKNEIEEQLKRALRASEPPDGFVGRVLARAEQERSQLAPRFPWKRRRVPSLRWAAVAALVAIAVTGIGYDVHERQEAEARAAKQQVMLALRITGSKLRVAKQKVKAVETGKVENTL
jgi:hypothetical protein